MDACAMDMRAIGELKSQVYPSLEHGHSKHLVKTMDFFQRKSRNMHACLPAPPTHTHTFSYNFKEFMESMNPRRETLNEKKSHYFAH